MSEKLPNQIDHKKIPEFGKKNKRTLVIKVPSNKQMSLIEMHSTPSLQDSKNRPENLPKTLDRSDNMKKRSELYEMFRNDSKGHELEDQWEKIKDFRIQFDFSTFFFVFSLYMLYFFFFGPIFSVLCCLTKPGHPFIHNIGIAGLSKKAIFNLLFYFIHIYASVRFFFYSNFEDAGTAREVIPIIEILFMWVGLLIRSFYEATKFAFICRKKLNIMHHRILTKVEIFENSLLGAWVFQCPGIILNEVRSSIFRYDSNSLNFHFDFLIDVSKRIKMHLVKNSVEIEKYRSNNWGTMVGNPIKGNTITYYGVDIFYELAMEFKKLPCAKFIGLKVNIYSFILASTPFIVMLIPNSQNMDLRGMEFDILAKIGIVFINFMVTYRLTYLILEFYTVDLKRKIYFMNQLAYMISTKGSMSTEEAKKLFPTINFLCGINSKAWSFLRHICLDYGAKFQRRGDTLLTFFIFCFFFEFLAILSGIFKIIQISRISLIILCIKFLINNLIMLRTLYYGARINEFFDIHFEALDKNKKLLLDVQNFSKHFAGVELHSSSNNLFKYVILRFKEYLKAYNTNGTQISEEEESNKISQFVGKSIELINRNLDELQFDKENKPFRVIGIPISKTMLNNMIVGIMSVAAAGVDFLVKG